MRIFPRINDNDFTGQFSTVDRTSQLCISRLFTHMSTQYHGIQPDDLMRRIGLYSHEGKVILGKCTSYLAY